MCSGKIATEYKAMSRRDAFHDLVRDALKADGWLITHDPYTVRFGEDDL
jgi:Holliday junction resolvase-like predicted endonuclease